MNGEAWKVGDLADHRNGKLDPRKVAWVSRDGSTLALDIMGGMLAYPVEAADYRRVPQGALGPLHLLTGTIPPDQVPLAEEGVTVLVTVWPDGTAEIATRDHNRWGVPARLEVAP